MIADDLFAGAGGWVLAAAALGIHARGVENMKEARATRDAAGLTTIHDDVWTFRPKYRVRWATPAEVATGAPTSSLHLEASGLIASPPCQTFSAAGKGSGRKALKVVTQLVPHVGGYTLKQLRRIGTRAMGDERTALVLTPLWFALHHPYQWLAWEQVPTVLPVWEACAEVLREHGWHVWTGILHAEQYGVPQTRKRAFLLASRVGPVEPPKPTHSRYYSRSPEKLDEGVQKWVSMAEALGWVVDRTVATGNFTARDHRGQRGVQFERSADAPSPTVTGVSGRWQLRNNTSANAAVRHESHPAPTMYFGARLNSMHWEPSDLVGFPRRADTDDVVTIDGQDYRARDLRSASHPAQVVTEKTRSWQRFTHMGDVYNSHGCVRSTDEPAPTMTASMDNGNFRWHDRPTPAIEGETAEDVAWADDCPSPTIVGSYHPEVVAKRGYRKPGDPPRQKTPGSIRVTVEEAGVLQSFPADYPWQGTKTKQFLQCGNAVPPGMAWHALSAAAVHHLAQLAEEVAS